MRPPYTIPSPALVAGVSLCCLLTTLAPAARAQTLDNVHRSSGGVQGNAGADFNGAMSISDDGLYACFASYSTNLVAGDTNPASDVFVRNLATGVTVMVTRDIAGGPINSSAFRPWISGNGRYVVYQSDATDIVAGDVNGANDVFRHDRDTDADGIFDEPGATATIIVSRTFTGAQANGPSRCYTQSVSDDGNRIAFESAATNLVAGGDTNGTEDCFVRDVLAATTMRASVATGGAQSNCTTARPAISGDGFSVAFTTSYVFCNLAPGDSPGADVYVRNLAAGTTTLASVAAGGGPANGSSFWPTLSDDGDRVAFESTASDVVAGDLNGAQDIFVRTLSTGATVRASVLSGGGECTGMAQDAFISGDGTTVSYTSSDAAAGLETNGVDDVFVRDLAANLTARASRPLGGGEGNGRSYLSALSEDGDAVVFASQAANLIVPDTNGGGLGGLDVFVRTSPLTSPDVLPPPPPPPPPPGPGPAGVDANPVTFSVNGPVDPHTEGIRDPRGVPAAPGPLQDGDGIAFGVRIGAVPPAAGLPTIRPGDVFDYAAIPFPSEAVTYQSMPPVPPLFPEGDTPDGTNNQIIEAIGAGLVAGIGLPPLWTALPMGGEGHDNIDAISFGEDYFPPGIMVGLDPISPFPDPPMGVSFLPWAMRGMVYKEPVVLGDAPGISFRFSVDPWAVGLPGNALPVQAAPGDIGAGLGPWTSGGGAAGDVFATPVLMRAGGVTVVPGGNVLVHDQPTLGLAPAPPPMMPMEDDLDALECVGDNTNWMTGAVYRTGNVHARVMDVGVDLPAPMVSAHDPVMDTPIFFSVTRNSPGAAGSAVRSQFVTDGGAASDIFVMVKDPAAPPGVGTNLLFIDEAEIGNYAVDASPGGTGPMDYTDDLDGLILRVCPQYRAYVANYIKYLVMSSGGPSPWMGYAPGTGALTGGGMTISITKLLAATIPPGCIEVGFSVTTDAIGLLYTGVDYEAGPIGPVGGPSAAAGDIFYATVTGAPANRNYLWYEETDLGLDPGVWMNGVSTDLGDLSDNLNALDSIDSAAVMRVALDAPEGAGLLPQGAGIELASIVPNPFRGQTTLRYRTAHEGHVRVTIHDLAGRVIETLADGFTPAGEHVAKWEPGRGGSAPSGIYFVKATLDGVTRSKKVILKP